MRVADLLELEFHKAIIQDFWNAIELLGKVIFDGKTDACLTSIFTAAATPEKGVASLRAAMSTQLGSERVLWLRGQFNVLVFLMQK